MKYKYFRLAKQIALKGNNRHYWLGAIGIRSDGAMVASNNIPNRCPEFYAHAEARLVRKLDWGSIVYVVRVRKDGTFGLARPCKHCQMAMRLRGVKRCYYSINNNEFGVIKL